MNPIEYARLVYDYMLARLRIDPSDEGGLTTTEVAAITFLLVGGAILVVGIIVAAAKRQAETIPDAKIPS
jgi:hypothetical protein